MNALMDWLSAQMRRISTWWNNNHVLIKQDAFRVLDLVSRVFRTSLIMGVILNVVASYFSPDFPERFPTIYGWCDGCLQFYEFLLKYIFGGIRSFFTGQMLEFWTEAFEALSELLQQFANWLGTIHF